MKDPVIIRFRDRDTSDDAIVIVRHDETSVVVGLSLMSNGDLQVVMGKDDARQLLEALRNALN